MSGYNWWKESLTLHCVKMLCRPRVNVKANANVTKPMIRHRCQVTNADIVQASHILGESITTFVAVYCTLQWKMYRDIRQSRDKDDNDNDNDNDNSGGKQYAKERVRK